MSVFGNRAISASAGTGKTWALAHRYLALLAADVPPDRICALTFSRKAAGEIFDAIVERLCLSALDDAQRRLTAECVAMQGIDVAAPASSEAYVRLLRRLLDQVHRLRVGTLDSFILGVVRSFPLELGLPPDVRPMDNDGGEAAAVRKTLLARLCDPRWSGRAGGAKEAGAELLDAFRQAMFGQESKGLARRLEGIAADYHDFFRLQRDRAWGDEERIWPTGRWWESISEADLAKAGEADYQAQLRSCFGSGARPGKLGEACAEVAAAGAVHTVDRPFPEKVNATLLPQLLSQAGDAAAPTLTYYSKPYPVPDALWPSLRAAVRNLVRVEVHRSARRTAGLRDVLERYDAIHGESQRREGRLAFNDFALRLGEPGHRPSLDPHAADRLYIDYRLDGQLDHWLLDEFQDTSDIQWQAIANLADEVVQDAGQSRSFFYVGDIKQSIYGWRGGNHRLFGEVARRGGIPRGTPLVACHRSLPAIIRAVNAVFNGLDAWVPAAGPEKGPHPDAVGAFMAEWQPHVSARLGEGEGFAALLQYDRDGGAKSGEGEAASGDTEDGDPAQYEAVARVLAGAEPVRRGLSAAVLVRGNAQGRTCADVLRRRLPGVPVVHEGTGGIVDNPVVTLLLALVRYAAHPADTLALRHLQMSPLARDAGRDGGADWLEGFCGSFLSQVHEEGFAGTLRTWGGRLLASGAVRTDDAFGRQRLDELLAAAEAFDATGSRDPDAFVDHIRAHQTKSESAAGAVRVMTIHQSKGLGFDLVVVPFDPSAKSFGDARAGDLLVGGQTAADGWVLQPPVRAVLEAAAGAPLRALETVRAEANFAQLCVLYVALTRAKRGLYLLVPAPTKTSSSVREADLLRERLGDDTDSAEAFGLAVLGQQGDPRWFETFVPDRIESGQREAGSARMAPLPVAFVEETVRREPSKERAEGAAFPADRVFDREAGDVRDFGSAIHRLFEGIEWLEDIELEQLVRRWRAESPESTLLLDDVERQFRRCVSADAVRALLRRPDGVASAVAWRETPFSVVREGDGTRELVMGRFDRLVVERDAAGRAVRATIVDFKSNRVADEAEMRRAAEGYALQMRDYAAAAARLLDLPSTAVRACLLFTRLARICD